MATYAIGDIQGCLSALQALLLIIDFDEGKDELWFTGDLVNRGPASLETLRFIKNLKGNHRIVLGNHDLHLLAIHHHAHPGWEEDTLQSILTANDREELLGWLIQQPLLHYDEKLGFLMVHAGIAPDWTLATAQQLADEIKTILLSPSAREFFCNMYGNLPNQWHDSLTGWDRYRCITNYLTRARFCYPDGRLELRTKGKLVSSTLIPWFNIPSRVNKDLKIIFGHWAALGGVTNTPNIFALDTGCVWGYSLTAMCLEDGKRFSVSCHAS